MTDMPKIGCVGHDCDECRSRDVSAQMKCLVGIRRAVGDKLRERIESEFDW